MEEGNTDAMWNCLTKSEKEKYFFDTNSLDLNELADATCFGIKVYLAKEKIEDNYKAVRKQQMYYFKIDISFCSFNYNSFADSPLHTTP